MSKSYTVLVDFCAQCPESEIYENMEKGHKECYCYAIDKMVSNDINEYKEIHPDCPLEDD